MRLTILGSGTSMGIPVIGCHCDVCTSIDPRNHRLRTSALLEHDGTTLLIDAGPDLRTQMLRHRVTKLDALLLTHAHADHIGGIDDLRPFTMRSERSLPVYGDPYTLGRVRHMFDYVFVAGPSLSTRPQLETHSLPARFEIGSITVEPLDVMHGPHAITAYRFGPLAYITDASAIPPESMERLRGLDVLIINALRFDPHPLHFTVNQALAIVTQLQPRRAFFTHITHDLDHATVNAQLPPPAQLAHDGQVIEIAL
ncbi:MAG TPA: MBL fold metallo-hydrolase [Herpetosiphonaceae bacterium]